MSGGYGNDRDGGKYGQNPYAQQDSYNPYGTQNNGYGQEPTGNYEMAPVNGQAGGTTQDFYDEVDQIRNEIDTVNANISRIESLHQRSLTDIDVSAQQQTQSQLEAIVTETSALNNALVGRIRILKTKASRDASKEPQVGVLDRNLKAALRKYQLVEKNFADRTREQMARQYLIVKPDATKEEVQQACEDTQGQQIFSDAIFKQTRRGEARSALQEVQARHTEIQRIEKTIVELAELFNQMEQLVTEQQTMVDNIDMRGEEVVENVGKAQDELGGAVDKARAARRKKWWCLLIALIILCVIAAIVAAVVVTQKNNK